MSSSDPTPIPPPPPTINCPSCVSCYQSDISSPLLPPSIIHQKHSLPFPPPPSAPSSPFTIRYDIPATSLIIPITFHHHHTLKQSVQYFWSKYDKSSSPSPDTIESSSVLGFDTLKDEVSVDGRFRYKQRKLYIKNQFPWIFRQVFRQNSLEFFEESVEDISDGTLEMRSTNLSYNHIVCAVEQSKFSRDPTDPKFSYFQQTGGIRCGWGLPITLAQRIEQFVAPRMRNAGFNAAKQMEEKMDQMNTEANKDKGMGRGKE